MQRVFIGALCRQMSSCNQSERDAIFGRVSYERKLNNHHDQGRRQGATAIIEFFSVTHASKNVEGARGRLCSSKGGACAMAQWHNGQSKPDKIPHRMHQNSPYSDQKQIIKFWGGGTRPRIAGETRLVSWTTLSTGSTGKSVCEMVKGKMCGWGRR